MKKLFWHIVVLSIALIWVAGYAQEGSWQPTLDKDVTEQYDHKKTVVWVKVDRSAVPAHEKIWVSKDSGPPSDYTYWIKGDGFCYKRNIVSYKTVYYLDAETGEKKTRQVPVYGTSTSKKWKFKDGYRYNPDTGANEKWIEP